MNKINHDSTKKHILSVMDILREQAKTASEHVAKLAEIETSEAFSETYKQEQVTELRSNYHLMI